MEDGGGIGGYVFPGVFLLLAAGAFLYANVVYTPEIIAANEQMKLESREVEIRKLLSAVQQHKQDGLDLEDLRIPLEASFGMTIEEYVSKVDDSKDSMGNSNFTSADEHLADVFRSISRVR
jgi:hypothetical protein